MTSDFEHVEFAQLSEDFVEELQNEFEDRRNWMVTIHFYSLLHYVEERLSTYGYDSNRHHIRKENIRKCKQIDNRVRTLYRRLEDLSRDARYELVEMEESDVEKSKETLEEGKEILGFSNSGDTYKYRT